MPNTVADTIVATLSASGVRRVYGVPGGSLAGFAQACRPPSELAWEPVDDEETAAVAAAGEAALTRRLAVCAGGGGSGNLRLINGLTDAHIGRVPVLAIAVQTPCDGPGAANLSDTHPRELFGERSVHTELVRVAEEVPRILENAMRRALELSGVAVVALPAEILLLPGPPAARPGVILRSSAVTRPSDDELTAAARLLNTTESVTILAGAGCQGAHDELMKLAARLKAPVVHTLRSKELVEYDNAYDVGMTGLLGFVTGYRAMEHCGGLVMLGTDFPYRAFYPERARVIQVDIRGEQIGRRIRVDLGLVGTVRDTIQALLPHLRSERDATHLARMRSHYRRTRERGAAEASTDRDCGAVHPRITAAAIDRLASDDAVFLPDLGIPTLWAARNLRMNGRRRLLGSWNGATTASALQRAIGVQACQPGRQVVTLSADLTIMPGELRTLQQRGLPVKVVVHNHGAPALADSAMDTVSTEVAGSATPDRERDAPRFADLADAVGVFSVRVERSDDLEAGLGRAFGHDGPAVIEVLAPPREWSILASFNATQAKGLDVEATRSVLSAEGDEVVEVARANLQELAGE